MPPLYEYPRTLVVCRNCGSPVVGRELADGTIQPIGSGTTCPCGCAEFRVRIDNSGLTEAATAVVIGATGSQCTPDHTAVMRSVCE